MDMPGLSGRILCFPSDFLTVAQHSTEWLCHDLLCPLLLGCLVSFQPYNTANATTNNFLDPPL